MKKAYLILVGLLLAVPVAADIYPPLPYPPSGVLDIAKVQRESYIWMTDTPGGPLANTINPFFSQALATGTVAIGSGTSNHPGIFTFSSAAGANSGYTIWLGHPSSILLAGGEHFEFIWNYTATTDIVMRAGYSDSITVAAAVVDGVYLNFAGSTLTGIAVNNSNATSTTTSYTVPTTTWLRYTIDLDNSASAATFRAYSEGGTLLWSDTVASNIPTAAGRETALVWIVYKTSVNIAEIGSLDWIWASTTRKLVR